MRGRERRCERAFGLPHEQLTSASSTVMLNEAIKSYALARFRQGFGEAHPHHGRKDQWEFLPPSKHARGCIVVMLNESPLEATLTMIDAERAGAQSVFSALIVSREDVDRLISGIQQRLK